MLPPNVDVSVCFSCVIIVRVAESPSKAPLLLPDSSYLVSVRTVVFKSLNAFTKAVTESLIVVASRVTFKLDALVPTLSKFSVTPSIASLMVLLDLLTAMPSIVSSAFFASCN